MGEQVSDFVDIAARVMSASEQRLEYVATNVSNTSTPGFKRQGAFQISPPATSSFDAAATLRLRTDFSAGSLKVTGNAFDLAIDGAGFFSVQGEGENLLTRSGQFQRTPEGRLVTAQGFALQDSAGGDLIVNAASPEILADGTVLENGLPTGRVALLGVDDMSALMIRAGGMFALPPDTEAVPDPQASVRQGMLEGSNVAMPAEMLEMMEAVRQAETGARLVQLYDTLMGRAISTFGQRS
jgi:flagellar basal-body rod protein FlgF